ncbi:DUF3857 domain-containing protein [Zunongwangia sp.]|uniref:DUF3857 domain-containing protein n=1 Tax=Zunongwangia sp. TaxID=1965325 RepID=UPI003AA8E48F
MRNSSFLAVIFLLLATVTNAQDYKFGNVSKKEIEQTAHAEDPEAEAAFLYRYRYTTFDISKQGLQLITHYHNRIKIYKKSGFEWASKTIPLYFENSNKETISGLKAYTYNLSDGKISKEKLDKDQVFEEDVSRFRKSVKFTMPAIKEGSVIEYKYKIISPFFASLAPVELQYTIPLDKIEVTLKLPEFLGYIPHYNQRAKVVIPMDQSSENFRYSYIDTERSGFYVSKTKSVQRKVEYLQNVYKIDKENIPALKDEDYVDYLKNYAAKISWELQYTKFPNSPINNISTTWENVAKTLYDEGGLLKELKRSNFFEDDLESILANTQNKTEQLQAILAFVKQKIGWNNYLGYLPDNGTKKGYKEGVGNVADINLLLTAMLTYKGFEAYPVLVSTVNHGIPLYPTQSGFNYLIAAVKLENSYVLLDATDQYAGLGELPKRARNWQGRLIKDDGTSSWVSLYPNKVSKKMQNVNILFDLENKEIRGRVRAIYSGFEAKSFRNNYKGLDRDEYIKLLQEKNDQILVDNYSLKNEKNIGSDIKESYEYTLQNAYQKVGEQIYINPLQFLARKENPFKADERTYPVYMKFPVFFNKTASMKLPEGYEITSLPESIHVVLNKNDADFKFIVNGGNGYVRIVSTFTLKKNIFLPEEYKSLKNFYDEIVSKQSEVLVLSKINTEDESRASAESR